MKTMRLFMITCCLLTSSFASTAALADEFRDPSEETKPWCYWYWLNGDISKEGITKDLESMAKVGIKRAMIGNVSMEDGPVKMFSPEWYDATRHAHKEANRLSIELMSFNAPGWSQSGGPWITPEQSMRRVSWHEFPAEGGAFSQKIRPDEIPATQDIAVLAVPRLEAVSIVGAKQDDALHFTHTTPFTARALVVHGKAKAKLYALQDGKRIFIADINAKGGSDKTDFLPNAIETFSFKEVTAQQFELVPATDAQVVLTSEPKVAQVIEKQMGRMHPTPSPTWESYIFPDTVEPDDSSTVIKQSEIINLSDQLNAEGVLTCELPKGSWDIIYFGMVTTGKTNGPAPPEATGLECDKLSKKHIESHFNSMFGKLLEEMTPGERAAFKGITIDSYEVGAQNWTDDFANDFEKRNGYTPISLLPVMTGRVLDSAKTSDQYLWDLRRTIADMIAENYVGGLRDVAHENGLTLWMENYGHWGFPAEFLSYGAYTDEIGGEFWTKNKSLGTIECRAASSAGHINGKRRIYSEAFTSGLNLGDHPYLIKARGEELFCEGVNHFVLHVYAHQAKDGTPGKNPWFGTAFHRNTPWFNASRDWVKYLQRCHYMLQQGNPVADVAVYIGDFAPQMTGPANPIPAGYDYDYINSDTIMNRLNVVDGDWVVYDEHDPKRIAARWKLLAMPMDKLKYIRPQVLASLDTLKKQGGKVVESVPVTAEYLGKMGALPAVSDTTCAIRWKQRRTEDADIFFVSNFQETGSFSATFRTEGNSVEVFNPYNGESYKTAWFQDVANGTRVTLDVKDKSDSFFVVVRKGKVTPSVVSVQRDGQEVSADAIKLSYNKKGKLIAETSLDGNYSVALSNGKTRELSIKNNTTQTLSAPWKINFGTENSTALEAFSIQIDKLLSWDKLTDPKAQNFTGTANYETVFAVDSKWLKKDKRIYLDLGSVNVMAGISINGKTLETLWMPPFKVDITELVKKGNNKLNVEITSTSPCESPGLMGPVRLTTSIRKGF